jgi:ferredoxin-NADP reductase/bacterioferritin-associated ferredoxin
MKLSLMRLIAGSVLLVLASSGTSYSDESAPAPEVQEALAELKIHCETAASEPSKYRENFRDKSMQSVPVETSPGVVKYDTFIKVAHDKGSDYVSCFQTFKTPLQAQPVALGGEQRAAEPCVPADSKNPGNVAEIAPVVSGLSGKMACPATADKADAKEIAFPQCVQNLTACGLEDLHVNGYFKVGKSKGFSCGGLLGQAGDVGACMGTFIRGAFDEITDTLKMLVVDGPKWLYDKTLGQFFKEPAVKQMENVGSLEAVSSSTQSDAQIREEVAEPEKALLARISEFAEHLILDKGAESYGCTKWSSGVPGVGTCEVPGGTWECASCKQKAMAVCGIAGYATGMVVETAVLAAPVGVVAGSTVGLISKTGKVAEVASAGAKVAKTLAQGGLAVAKVGVKIVAPIGRVGYRLGKGAVDLVKLIPGAKLAAKTVSSPFKLWMKADDLLTSKVWNLSYHGSKAYTQTLAKTGNVALATKSAAVASRLNQAQRAGKALLETQSELKLVEQQLESAGLAARERQVAVAKQRTLAKKLKADSARYEKLSNSITAKGIEETKLLQSEHADSVLAKYNEVQAKLAKGPAAADAASSASDAGKVAAEVAEEGVGEPVAGPVLKLTKPKIAAEELAKIIAVDADTQKLLSDPVVAQYVYVNYFAPVKEQSELKTVLQDIANSTESGGSDIFALVNDKLAAKIKDPAVIQKVKDTFSANDKGLRPSKLRSKLFEAKSRAQQLANLPKTVSRLKKLTDEGFSLEVLDQGLFDFYGATQLGLKDSQLRPWENVAGGLSSVRPDQIEGMSPQLWADMARFASETEAPIHGYSTNSGDALRGLIPSISRFMGKNEDEYKAFQKGIDQAVAEGKDADEVMGPFCTNVWCKEEKRHETVLGRLSEQVSGKKDLTKPTYEADKMGDYLDPNYGLLHLASRNSSEWNANSTYIYLRSHSKGAANKLADNIRKDETKHMAIFSSAYKYFFGNQLGKRTKEMLQKIAKIASEAKTANSAGDVITENVVAVSELGITHLFVENKVRDFIKSVPLKTMEKIFDSPVKTLVDLETVPLSAEKLKAVAEMNAREAAKRQQLARWTPKERATYQALKQVETQQGPLIESLIANLFDGFRGAEVPESAGAKAMLARIKKLRTGLDAKENALIQMSLRETMRDYQIMNNKAVRANPDLKVVFKNAREGFHVEHKGPGEAAVLAAEKLTDSTYKIRVQKPKGLELKPGDAVRVAINTPAGEEFRVLSLASSPDKDHLEFAVGISDSEFKKGLMKLKPGETVTLSKAKGSMDFDPSKPAVMIAGGIGITPFRSMIQYAKDNKLGNPIHLYYANRSQIPFGQELTKLAENTPDLSVTTVLSQGDEHWKGLRGRIDEPFLAREVPKLPKDAKYYIVGPPAMITGTQENLIKLGVDPKDIQIEAFAFEKPEAARSAASSGAAGEPPVSAACKAEKAVCVCYGIPASQIITSITKGARTVEDIAEATEGATRGCGGCTKQVGNILKCELQKLGQ